MIEGNAPATWGPSVLMRIIPVLRAYALYAEPLYCPNCGVEIGPDHGCDWDWQSDPMPTDPFCEITGLKVTACRCCYCHHMYKEPT
jgi:hypothetical protein